MVGLHAGVLVRLRVRMERSECMSVIAGRGGSAHTALRAQTTLTRACVPGGPAMTAGEQRLTGHTPKAEAVVRECFLIRGALSLADQLELSKFIASRDNTPTNEPRAMVPAPRTLVLGDDGTSPSVRFHAGDNSIVSNMVSNGLALLQREGLASMAVAEDISQWATGSMATIRYEAPTGRFPPHVDHCNKSAVFLASLGRSANFMVRGKGEQEVRRFKLHSGDVLVFNASTEADILHGVESIDEVASEAGDALADAFPVFRTHRYGVQCRIYYSS
jgi:hypothetical protein